MSAPVKPWESVGPNLRSSATHGSPGPLHSYSSVGQMPPPSATYRRTARTFDSARVAPPIPSRVAAYRQSYGRTAAYGAGSYGGVTPHYMTGGSMGHGYGAYGGGYGGGYGGAYSGYGSSQLYGGGGAYGMNRYPHPPGMSSLESRFIQMAEENSRPAFESIESLVQAFGSVTFMMESTFHAMYSSFRAVLGVAENFGRLRSLFGQVFQTFAVLRLFQWIYRKLLYYLGIRHDNPGREAVWKEATGQLDPKTRRTFWPVAMFLGLVCGGPFLVWRLLKSIGNLPPPPDSATSPRAWVTGGAVTLPLAVGLYDFTAARENEISLRVGQQVWVAPAHLQAPESEWVLVTTNWKESGLVPANFIQVYEHRKFVKSKPNQGVAKQPELSPEIATQGGPIDAEGDRLREGSPTDQVPPDQQQQGAAAQLQRARLAAKLARLTPAATLPQPLDPGQTQEARHAEYQPPRPASQPAPETSPQTSPQPPLEMGILVEPSQTQPTALPTDKPVEASS